MPDKSDNTEELSSKAERNSAASQDDADRQAAAVAAGRRLHDARVAAEMSVTEVNSRIHLTREVVLALEAGEFASIGAPVFVRGHLRSYTKLLNLPQADILDACPDLNAGADEFRTHSSLKEYKPGFSIVNAVLLGGLVLLLVVAFFYWIAGNEDSSEQAEVGNLTEVADAYQVASMRTTSKHLKRFDSHSIARV